MSLENIKALTFDVFGTVVDSRGSIIAEAERIGKARGVETDWGKFFDAWRAGYGSLIEDVRHKKREWANIDALHRVSLDAIIEEFSVGDLTEDDRQQLNMGWHRLTPWPDSVPGLTRLKEKYILVTLSNGHLSLLVNMAKHGRLPWDCILAPDILDGHYKPDPGTYTEAARRLELSTDQIMMVAAHKPDLKAAHKQGMKAAYVPRLLEYGPGVEVDTTGEPWIDVVANDFEDLATKLGT